MLLESKEDHVSQRALSTVVPFPPSGNVNSEKAESKKQK